MEIFAWRMLRVLSFLAETVNEILNTEQLDFKDIASEAVNGSIHARGQFLGTKLNRNRKRKVLASRNEKKSRRWNRKWKY